MKQNKQPPESLPQVPTTPKTEVPPTERERAENEGMTAKPNHAPSTPEAARVDMAKAPHPAVYTPQTGGPKIEALEGEGSYTAARRYREGVERSVHKGDSEELAQEAADALDGPEGAALRAAAEHAKHGTTPHTHAEERGKHGRAPDAEPASHTKAPHSQADAPARSDKDARKPGHDKVQERQSASHR